MRDDRGTHNKPKKGEKVKKLTSLFRCCETYVRIFFFWWYDTSYCHVTSSAGVRQAYVSSTSGVRQADISYSADERQADLYSLVHMYLRQTDMSSSCGMKEADTSVSGRTIQADVSFSVGARQA